MRDVESVRKPVAPSFDTVTNILLIHVLTIHVIIVLTVHVIIALIVHVIIASSDSSSCSYDASSSRQPIVASNCCSMINATISWREGWNKRQHTCRSAHTSPDMLSLFSNHNLKITRLTSSFLGLWGASGTHTHILKTFSKILISISIIAGFRGSSGGWRGTRHPSAPLTF